MEIHPVKVKKPKPNVGDTIFPGAINGGVYITGKPLQGKSTLLFNIIERLIKESKLKKIPIDIILFCPTAFKDGDAVHEELERMILSNKIPFRKFNDVSEAGVSEILHDLQGGQTDANQDKTIRSTVRSSSQMVAQLKKPAVPSVKQLERYTFMRLDQPIDQSTPNDSSTIDPTIYKTKAGTSRSRSKKPTQHIVIFDDASDALRNKDISTFVKKARHHNSRVIVSSQGLKDALTGIRTNLAYFLTSKGFSRDELDTLREMSGNNLSKDDFHRLYREITDPDHAFMYINKATGQIRRNFSAMPYQTQYRST